jgi:2'-5' RNA ligase
MSEPYSPPATSARPRTLRVFYALWPGEEARRTLLALAKDVATAGRGRAPPPQNMHLTLAFVGEVAAERLPALQAIGARAAAAGSPFTLRFDRLGSFRDSGIAWLGTGAAEPALQALVNGLAAGLAADGFPVERRPFRAHVTLARRCARPPVAADVPAVIWTVETFTLTASELARGGSQYRTLAAWPLAGTAPS